jgi:hypothetical protein
MMDGYSVAQRTMEVNPDWTIIYGELTHDFYAFHRFLAGISLRESDPQALIRGMREQERLADLRKQERLDTLSRIRQGLQDLISGKEGRDQ